MLQLVTVVSVNEITRINSIVGKWEIFLQFHKLNTNKLVYNKGLYAPKLTQLSMQKEGKIRKIQRDFNWGSSTARSSLVIIGTGVQSRNC